MSDPFEHLEMASQNTVVINVLQRRIGFAF